MSCPDHEDERDDDDDDDDDDDGDDHDDGDDEGDDGTVAEFAAGSWICMYVCIYRYTRIGMLYNI